MSDENLFNETPLEENTTDESSNEQIVQEFSLLVGEGRKYKDENALAKGYMNAESFIEELRADLAKERAAKTPPSPPVEVDTGNNRNPPVERSTPPVKEDLANRIREELKILSEEEKLKGNLANVEIVMLKNFGDQKAANAAIISKAKELNVSTKWLEDTAKSTPNAFFTIMGVTETVAPVTPASTPAPKGNVNLNAPLANKAQGERGYAFYEQLRRSDKGKYFTPAIQKEMVEQRKKLGDNFYQI